MIRLRLDTLGGTKFDDDVAEVLLPTMDGEIGVLTGHMDLIAVAVPGVIKIRVKANDPDDFREYFAVNGGVIEVSDNVLSVLVDDADDPDDINETEAKEAYERAQKMKAEAKDAVSLEQAQHLIDRHAVRLQVAGLKRRNRR